MKGYQVSIPISSYNELTTSCVILANCGVLVDNLINMFKQLFNTKNIVPTRDGLRLNNLNAINGTIPEYSFDVFTDLMRECFPDKKYEIVEVNDEEVKKDEESEDTEGN